MKIRSIALSLLFAFSGMSLMAMQNPSFYDVLGVSKDASLEEITQEYRKLARQNHPDKNLGDKAAEARMKSINDAYETLGDAEKRQKYDQPAASNAYFAGNGNVQGDAFDQVILLAGVASAKTTFSYLTLAWDQYTMHKNFIAIKKHIALQLKNKQENKPVARMCDSLDLAWVMRLRQGQRPSPIEQAIEQFDQLVVQNPQSLPTISTHVVKLVDTYSNAIGNGNASLFKAAAIVGMSTVGYLTSDKWLPQVLNSKLFYIALRLFS